MTTNKKRPRIMLAMSELFTLVPPRDERRHLDLARIAEAEGIAGLFVSEHVVMGPNAGALGRAENPRQFVAPGMQDPDMPWPSPLLKLAAMGAVTSTIRLMACALIAPLRHPITLAKELATLDLLTGGRLTVLPTVSWQKEEYEALQMPFDKRGRHLDEHLAIWHTLWRDTPAAHRGEFYRFENVHFSPQPEPGSIKIWIGGAELHDAALRRAVRYARGLMMGYPLDAAARTRLADAMIAAGRDVSELEIAGWLVPTFDTPDRPADFDRTLDAQLPALIAQGCDLIAIKPSCFFDDPAEMESFCRHVVRRLDQTT